MRRVLETDRTEIHTWMPGVLESYNATEQTCSVRLGAREILPSGDDDEPDTVGDYPILVDVPVQFPSGSDGGPYIAWALAAGCPGIVLFAECDIGAWRAGDGAPVDPGIATRHGLSGATFVPGLRPRSRKLANAPTTGLRMGIDGGTRVEIRSGAVEAGGTAALALAADVKAHLQLISADITAIKADLAALGPPAPTLVPTYVYATAIATSPIDTTVTKGS